MAKMNFGKTTSVELTAAQAEKLSRDNFGLNLAEGDIVLIPDGAIIFGQVSEFKGNPYTRLFAIGVIRHPNGSMEIDEIPLSLIAGPVCYEEETVFLAPCKNREGEWYAQEYLLTPVKTRSKTPSFKEGQSTLPEWSMKVGHKVSGHFMPKNLWVKEGSIWTNSEVTRKAVTENPDCPTISMKEGKTFFMEVVGVKPTAKEIRYCRSREQKLL